MACGNGKYILRILFQHFHVIDTLLTYDRDHTWSRVSMGTRFQYGDIYMQGCLRQS